MKYVSIDTETSGVPGKDGPIENIQIIEFGAVIEDSNNPKAYDDIPKFKRIIRHPVYSGGAFAINMNARIFKILAEREYAQDKEAYDELHQIITPEELPEQFFSFVYKHLGILGGDNFTSKLLNYNEAPFTIIPAGKNFGTFDKPIIETTIPGWSDWITLDFRILDPGTSFVDWQRDNKPPGLSQCKARAGVGGAVTHDALEDAWDVVTVFRADYKTDKPWKK